MADQLFLRIHDATDACSWVVLDSEARLVAPLNAGSLAEAAAACIGRRVTVLVPGVEVITTKADLPPASQARLRQMLPFSLEDRFADDIDELTFAAGPKLDAGGILVSVVARQKLEGWLARLSAVGISPQAVYADADGVPDTPSTLNVVVEDDTTYGRRPGQAALALQGLDLAQAFAVFTETGESEAAVQHAHLSIDAASKAENEATIALLATQLASLNVRIIEDTALPGFAAKLVRSPGTNLLQGRYAPKSNWAEIVRPWRTAAILLIGLGVIGLAANAAEYFKLRSQDAALTSAVQEQCARQLSIQQMRQCEAELQRRLQALGQASGSNEDFLSTLAMIAEHVDAGKHLETLSYRNRVLDIELVAPNVPALDEFGRLINDSGRFAVSIQSTNPQQEGGVEARVQIVGVQQ
jgi:general secretion pathway protein L